MGSIEVEHFTYRGAGSVMPFEVGKEERFWKIDLALVAVVEEHYGLASRSAEMGRAWML